VLVVLEVVRMSTGTDLVYQNITNYISTIILYYIIILYLGSNIIHLARNPLKYGVFGKSLCT